MRIVKNIGFVGLLLLGMGTQASAQQPTGLEVGVSVPYALDGLKDWTHESIVGLCLDVGYVIPLKDGMADFRAGLGLGFFPGKTYNQRKISLQNIQITGDFVFPVKTTGLSLLTGISLNTWRKDVSGKYPRNQTLDNNISGTVNNAFGKFGLRVGAEYDLSDNLAVSALMQLTELGTDREFIAPENYTGSQTEIWGDNRVNPSWIQVGVRYKF
jgi:hypothetical protein